MKIETKIFDVTWKMMNQYEHRTEGAWMRPDPSEPKKPGKQKQWSEQIWILHQWIYTWETELYRKWTLKCNTEHHRRTMNEENDESHNEYLKGKMENARKLMNLIMSLI